MSSELWRTTVKASDKLFMQVDKILKMSNHKFVSALLSKTVRKVLIKAGVTIQEDHFYLSVHPSAMRGDLHEDGVYTKRMVLLHDVFFRECRQLRSIAESIRTSVTPAQAAKNLEIRK